MGRPSLKNFLATGKVEILEEQIKPEKAKKPEKKPKPAKPKKIKTPEKLDKNPPAFFELLAPEDLEVWSGIYNSGAEFCDEKFDAMVLREKFREMDRSRFTLYVLLAEKEPLKVVRSGVGIREPFILFLLLDDEGVATIYTA